MKKIQIQNSKRSNAKRYLLFTVIFVVLSVVMVFNAISNNKKLQDNNFKNIDGIVNTFEITDTEYILTIKDLEDENNITNITLNIESSQTLPTLKDNLKVNDKIKLICNLEVKEIYKLTINDKLLYDRLLDARKSNNNLIIFYSIIGVIMIGLMAWNIVTVVKEPATKEIDYIEYIIANNRALTNAMLKEDSKTMKLVKKDQLLNKSIMLLMVLLFVGLIFSKSLFDNKLILLILTVVIVGLIIGVVVLLKPKFYSKHLQIFVEDYLDYFKSGALKEERTIFFEKDELRVIDGENTYTFKYPELNLFTVCVYSKSVVPVNIFICSQIPDKEEYKAFEDFIIPLSRDLYQDIINNSISIIGLEEVMNNLYEESKTNIQTIKQGISVKYYK